MKRIVIHGVQQSKVEQHTTTPPKGIMQHIQGGPKIVKPLSNYQQIMLNRTKAFQRD